MQHTNETGKQPEGIPIPRNMDENSTDRFKIKMNPVVSSNVEAVGYHPDLQIFQIRFKSGQTFQFFNVPPETFEEMKASDSIGKFFHARIKNQFSGDKLGANQERKDDGSTIVVTVYEIAKEYTVHVPRQDKEAEITKDEIMNAQQEAMLIVQAAKNHMQGREPRRKLLAVN